MISTRPAGPSGHRPSRSAVSGRSSSTTSQSWLVSASQLMKRAATDSAAPVGSIPVAAADACTNPDSTDARLVAEIQTSASMSPDRHSDSAMAAAIWVLPHAPSQFDGPSAKVEPGTSAMTEPGTTASMMPRAVSGLSVNPSASGGTSPTRNRGAACSADIPPEGTTARYPQLVIWCRKPARNTQSITRGGSGTESSIHIGAFTNTPLCTCGEVSIHL